MSRQSPDLPSMMSEIASYAVRWIQRYIPLARVWHYFPNEQKENIFVTFLARRRDSFVLVIKKDYRASDAKTPHFNLLTMLAPIHHSCLPSKLQILWCYIDWIYAYSGLIVGVSTGLTSGFEVFNTLLSIQHNGFRPSVYPSIFPA